MKLISIQNIKKVTLDLNIPFHCTEKDMSSETLCFVRNTWRLAKSRSRV